MGLQHVKLNAPGQAHQSEKTDQRDQGRERVYRVAHPHIGLQRLRVAPDVQVGQGAVLIEMQVDAVLDGLVAQVGVPGRQHMHFMALGGDVGGDRLDKRRRHIARILRV